MVNCIQKFQQWMIKTKRKASIWIHIKIMKVIKVFPQTKVQIRIRKKVLDLQMERGQAKWVIHN